MVVEDFYHRMGRTKNAEGDGGSNKRQISIFELALLGLSKMVGAGIYVLGGSIAKDFAGPASTLSFLLAAALVMPSALCGAELASYQPRANSVYAFVYITVGEFLAFFVGWTSLLRSAMASAAVAQAWSGCLDFLLDHRLTSFGLHLTSQMPFVTHLGLPDPPDIPAAAFILVIAVASVASRGISSKFGWAFGAAIQALNLSSVLLAMFLGFFWGDLANWAEYAPHGWRGVAGGAASALFAFGGWDAMLGASGRTTKPAASVAIAVALAALQYIGFCAALTLLVPWDTVAPAASFPEALKWCLSNGLASVMVAAGSLGAMSATLYGAVCQGSAALRALAADGLIPTVLPTLATGCIPAAILAALVSPTVLIQLLSLCTLVSYAATCGTLLLARIPKQNSLALPGIAVTLLGLSGGSGAFLLRHHLLEGHWPTFMAGIGAAFVAFASIAILWMMQLMGGSVGPKWEAPSFQMPLVPLLPSILLCFHVGLATFLQPLVWFLYGIWTLLGVVVYLTYSCIHSKQVSESKLPAHAEMRRDSMDRAFGA